MSTEFTIITNSDQNSELTIHPQSAAALGLNNTKFALLSFGSLKHYVTIKSAQNLPLAKLGLSANITKALYLPDYPVYELNVCQNEIVIGPYIGLLVSKEDRKLTVSRLKKMLVYVKEYTRLHGALVVFALNKVDPENRLIEGYCYNPHLKFWQKGVFPYPAALQRTIGLSGKWKNHFYSAIGDKIFNNRFFNKWEMYQWFSQEPEIKPHLADTVRYHAPQDLFEMLKKYPCVYLKPIFGLRGHGIVRISKDNHLYTFQYRKQGVNHCDICDESSQVADYLQTHFAHGSYLLQQAIDLFKYRGRIIDFRCIMQKNQANTWFCPAVIGRVGVANSIVSNISSGGTAFPAEKLLAKILPVSRKTAAQWQYELVALALTVCNKLTEYGIHCGSLGLDIGLDSKERLWLIEINNRDPDPSIALDIHDVHLYYVLKNTPLFYGKYLAGFPEQC